MKKTKKQVRKSCQYELVDAVDGYKAFRHNMRCYAQLSFRELIVNDPLMKDKKAVPHPGKEGIHFSVNPMATFVNYSPCALYCDFDRQPRYARVTGFDVNTKADRGITVPCYACKRLTREAKTMNIVDFTKYILSVVCSDNHNWLGNMGLSSSQDDMEMNHIIASQNSAGIVITLDPHAEIAVTKGAYSICCCAKNVGYYLTHVATFGDYSIAAMDNRFTHGTQTRMALAFGDSSVSYCGSQDGLAFAGGVRSVAIAKGARTKAIANNDGAVYIVGNHCIGVTRKNARVTGNMGTVILAEHEGVVSARHGTVVILQMPDGKWETLVSGCGRFQPYKYYSWAELVDMVKYPNQMNLLEKDKK